MNFTRREIVKYGSAALAIAKLSPMLAQAQPNSNFGGVQIGIILSPYNFPSIPMPADQYLNSLVQLGLSAVEMQDVRVEVFAGYPNTPRQGYSGARRLSPEERMAAERKQAEDLTAWRLASGSAVQEKYRELRKLYHRAGVKIYAFRLANMTQAMPDREFDYFFNTAKSLGADQITVELPDETELSQRVGDFAAQHKLMVGYHNEGSMNEQSWDKALAQSRWNGINLDTGHLTAAINKSPIPFIKEHHDRITCLHLKDRKYRINGGQNEPWGQGDTPIREILQLMKSDHYKFPAGIEFEYRIPAGSSIEAELTKCIQYCKDSLA
jgi:sugar phosphate isomerase/epimerase